MPDLLGYRAKIGVVVPSTNTTMEPELYSMAPLGVTFHTARLYLAQSSIGSPEEAQKAAAAFHTHRFGGGDFHVVNVVAVPDRLEQRVAKAENQNVLDSLFSKVMVDSVHIFFIECLVDHCIQSS